ncbi:MAG: transglutaminase family protein [Pseudomonadota bacterium]
MTEPLTLFVRHKTLYRFDAPVPYGLQQVRLTPKSYRAQTVLDWSVSVSGGRKELQFEDFHRNTVDLVSFEAGTTELSVQSEGHVEMTDTSGVLGPHMGATPLWLFLRQTLFTEPGPGLREMARGYKGPPTLDMLHQLAAEILARVAYKPGVSSSDWTAEEALAAGQGVCQDHTQIFLSLARALGVPARYVSGFLMLNDRVNQDATHAWAEAHVEGLGWVGFDVSNGISPDTRYVRVATGLDYTQAAPITGTRFGEAGEDMTVELEVSQQ